MEMNNESKHYFNSFLKEFNLSRADRRNVVILPNGEKFSFSVSMHDFLECRQTYIDCKGFISFHYDTGRYYIKRVKDVSSFPYSRTMRDGTTAHSVIIPLGHAELFHKCP